jgi:hypothetical protein
VRRPEIGRAWLDGDEAAVRSLLNAAYTLTAQIVDGEAVAEGQPCDVMSHVMSDHVDWRSIRGCDPVQCPWDRPRPGVRRG